MKIKKGYKNTTIGIIPEDWEVKKLSSQVFIDKSNIKSNFNKEYINYVSLSDIENGQIFPKKIKFTKAPSRARRITEKGDVLLSTVRPNLKNFAIINQDDLIASTGFSVLSFKKANLNFIYYFLYSTNAERQFFALTVGSNYPALNTNDVKNISLPIPPLPEQKEIANCLSTWDNGIEKLNHLIKLKKEQKKGLMQQLLTGSLRVKSSTGKPFKEDWKEVRLGDVGEIPQKEAITEIQKRKTLTVRLYVKGVDFSDNAKTKLTSTGRNYYIRNVGEILIGRQNIHNGGIGIVEPIHDGHICSNALTSYVVNNMNNKDFLFYLLSFPEIHQSFERFMVGTGQKEISEKELLKLKLKLPSLEEQNAIAAILQTADKEITLLEQKLAVWKEQKKGLMQVLLTGERRLLA